MFYVCLLCIHLRDLWLEDFLAILSLATNEMSSPRCCRKDFWFALSGLLSGALKELRIWQVSIDLTQQVPWMTFPLECSTCRSSSVWSRCMPGTGWRIEGFSDRFTRRISSRWSLSKPPYDTVTTGTMLMMFLIQELFQELLPNSQFNCLL